MHSYHRGAAIAAAAGKPYVAPGAKRAHESSAGAVIVGYNQSREVC